MSELILIWGTGGLAREITAKMNVKPDFYVDNNLMVCGSCIDDIPVINPLDVSVKDSKIVIASNHYYAIYIQALEMGFTEKKIHIVYENEILSPADSKLLINKHTDYLNWH